MFEVPVNGLLVGGIVYLDVKNVIDIVGCFQRQCGDNSRSELLTNMVKCIEGAEKQVLATAVK
jgi:hypothetical protein